MPVTNQQKFKLLILQARFLKEKFSMHRDIEQEAAEFFAKAFTEKLKSMPDEIKSFFKKESHTSNEDEKQNTPDSSDAKSKNSEQQEAQDFEKESENEHHTTEERTEAKRKEAPKHLRDVYKSIAKITHPDKLKGMSEIDRMQKEILFKRAQRAVSSGDYVELMDVALHLNIEFPNPSEQDTKHVRKSIDKTRKKIKKIENSAAWQWYHADKSRQSSIMKDYIYYVYQNEMR